MAKQQIYNYEIFSNKKEELKKIREKEERNRRIKGMLAVILLAGILLVLYIFQNSQCEYYSFKDKVKTEDNSDVRYETFGDGYIKYSGNGIEYQKKFGTSEWNTAVSFLQPFFVKSDAYAVLGDRNGNTLLLFDQKGEQKEITLKYPLMQADVSNQGIVEVILEGEDSNFIQVYDKEGKLIADMRSSVDETGYPVTAAISPDGTKLAVSYFAINGMTSKTTVAFYDFSQQLQTDDVTLKGGFDYEDLMIPKLTFAKNNVVEAFGDTVTYYYNIEEKPKVTKKIKFDKEIESIFVGDKYTGYVLDNSDNSEEGRHQICLYDKSGSEKLDMSIDMNYDTIAIWNKEIIAVQDNECTILNSRGKILFQGTLDGSSIEMIMPAKGWRAYHVIFRDMIVKMHLRFWDDEKS